MTALTKLKDLVEAGASKPHDIEEFTYDVWKEASFERGPRWEVVNHVVLSYSGSLDAAKALHEALLPYGLEFETFSLSGEVVLKRNRPIDRFYGFSDGNPARAWLLAILSALIAQEGEA